MSSCELCGKEFKFPYLLLRHLNKKYPCSSNKFSLETYKMDKEISRNDKEVSKNDKETLKSDKDVKVKKFECQKCEKKYVRKKEYSRHILNCTGLKSSQCPTCEKFFSSKQSKYQHIKNVKCSPPEDISEPHKNSVYLLIEREFMASKQNIFKIGRSVNVCNRTKRYPKGSQLLVVLPCIDSCVSECNIQKVFSEKFTQRKDIGSEYYEGPPNAIIKEFINNVDPHF